MLFRLEIGDTLILFDNRPEPEPEPEPGDEYVDLTSIPLGFHMPVVDDEDDGEEDDDELEQVPAEVRSAPRRASAAGRAAVLSLWRAYRSRRSRRSSR